MQVARPRGVMGLWNWFWGKRFLRFLVVGGLNTLFGFGCYVALVSLGLHYVLAVLLGTILGVLFNFQTTRKLVFASHDNRLIFRFFAVYVVQYATNIGLLSALVSAGFSKIVAGAILVLPMALFSFVLQRKFVFTR